VLRTHDREADARAVAQAGRTLARQIEETKYQAHFILAEADLLMPRKPQEARELLLLAKDLGEVLKDEEVLDQVTTSMMQLREAQLSEPQPTLWDAAEGGAN
jgi:hypothetical protein